MKNYLLHIVGIAAFCAGTFSCAETDEEQFAVFSDFSYRTVLSDNDEVASPDWTPLLPGCYPDPSIVRVGGDYYMVNSSFAFYPGVPIWHSTDLRNWERLGYVLNRREQLDLPDSLRISGGIYAPDISYNPHNETFYMISTLVDNGGTFYVTTDDPQKGVWSDPVWLPEVGGIDPSFLFDTDGRAYIVNNDGPEGQPLYDGHRTIRIHDFDWQTGRVTGGNDVLVDGGVDIAQHPVWIEGPHLYHIKDKYFLMCAEGGTGADHREVIFESKSPKGPFVPCRINPILSQRGLDPGRQYAVTSTGHADLVEDKDGKWWAVFLGVRPYSSAGHDIMGRETFIHPVSWIKGQPVITRSDEVLVGRPQREAESSLWSDAGLSPYAFFVRNPQSAFYGLGEDGTLSLQASEIALADRKSPSAIGMWATESAFEVTVCLDEFTPASSADFAGLLLFQDDDCNVVFGKTLDSMGNTVVRVIARSKGKHREEFDSQPIDPALPLNLKITADGNGNYSFAYSVGDGEGVTLGRTVSASLLSTATAGNFTGTMVGVYASSSED
ncbi:MAG: glycoside hydrolase family 43 protein [Staphylococcus sp.]|nr:glycoside hydrolase family 43 protein [Staphylococcus sp.]